MAKKKQFESYLEGYIPASYNPQINAKEIIQIPPYEDSGVRFQGYSKKLTGGDQYQLFPQIRRNQGGKISGNVATSITGQRLDPGKKFYVSNMHIDSSSTTDDILVTIADGTLASNNTKFQFTLSNDPLHFDIDFSSKPLEFVTDNISIILSTTLGAAGDYFQITLIGWAE